MVNEPIDNSTIRALQGRWTTIYQELDGQAVGPEPKATIVVELRGNEFTVEKNGAVQYEGTFTVGSGSPAEIVLIYKKSANPLFLGGTRPGLFQVEGDTLKWNIGAVGHSAPKALNTFPGSESVLSVYRRESAAAAFGSRTTSALRSVAVW
jgi:uncharacterized protein (TIGR03067 family)